MVIPPAPLLMQALPIYPSSFGIREYYKRRVSKNKDFAERSKPVQ
jgi:hypothetical protein